MGYISKGDRVTMAEQDLIDIIGVLGSPLQVLRVTADGLSLEYAAAGAGDVSKVGTPANNQVGVWTGDGTIEGDAALTFDTATDTLTSAIFNSTSLTASEIVATDGSKNLVSLAVATYPSLTELSYVKGVTSAIQTQLNAKGVGDMVLASAQSVTGLKTFDKDKFSMKGTSTGTTVISTANIGASSYTQTLQARDGTIANQDDTMYIGTTSVSLNRASASLALTGISSIDGSAASLTTTRTIWGQNFNGSANVTGDITLGASSITMTGSLAATGARVTKGWFSDIESTNMPTVGGVVLLTSLTAPQFTTIELGHASDTTLSRVSAGVVAIEGSNILTSATGLPLSGGTMSGNITLGENTSIALDPAGSADGKYTGLTVTGTAGYAQAFGDLVYLDPTDSRWEKTDANAAAAADGDSRGLLGMVVVAGAADGNACTILLKGIIRADAAFPAFTINNPIYVSETAGAVTQTQPTTTDAVIRLVGAALTADEMYFNPEWDWIAHT